MPESLGKEVIEGFSQEWARFNYYENLGHDALDTQFLAFSNSPKLRCFVCTSSIGADLVADSGSWT